MAADALTPRVLPDARRLAVRLGAGVAVLALAGTAFLALPGLDEVRTRLAEADLRWLAAALAFEVASLLAFVVAFRGVFTRRLPWRLSYELGMAVQGTNVLVPAGGTSGLALGAWALRRTGMPAEQLAHRTVAFFLVTSAASFSAAVVAGGALALGIWSTDAPLALTAGPAVAAALAMIAAVALARPLAHLAAAPEDGRLRRGLLRGAAALAGGIGEARRLVRSGDRAAVGGAVANLLFDMAALAAAFQAIGSGPALGVLLLAYVLGQLGNLVPLPGGVGGADSGLIAALVLYGTPLAPAAAAVLAYRAFQLGLPALLGALAMVRLPGALERAPRLASCGC